MTDFQPGDFVRPKADPDHEPDLIVEMPYPTDRRPILQGKIHLRRAGWVSADEWEIADPAENDIRREVLAILTRDNQTENPWTEDEKEAYREFGWTPGTMNANAIRVTKILEAVGKRDLRVERRNRSISKRYKR